MYNRGSEAVIRGVAFICRFWHPEARIVISNGNYGEVLKDISDADVVLPKYDASGTISYLLDEVRNADVVLVTGADNYDYGYDNTHMIHVNNEIFKNTKARTILYDCSLLPEHLMTSEFEDINRFSVITAREKRTANLFKEKFGMEKSYYYPDPAFVLPIEKCGLPYGFEFGNTIGINISNLIMGKRVGNSEEIVLANYRNVINYILRETTFNVLIIQHVMNNGFDLEAARKLYIGFEGETRVSIMESELLNSMQIKYIISKLRLLLTARTHASIAAYSTNVPTLVVGYSVKSIGIAEDIFGESEPYVINVRKLNDDLDLTKKFKYFLDNEQSIKKHLIKKMPVYKKKALDFGEVLDEC